MKNGYSSKSHFIYPCLQLKANHRPGEYGKWSDWSNCTAPDCKNNPNHAVMTRIQRNLADPTDVNTQEIPCESPCPPGENDMFGVHWQFLSLDCSVLEAVVKQTPIGDKYFINEVLKEPKTVNVSQVIMVRQYLHRVECSTEPWCWSYAPVLITFLSITLSSFRSQRVRRASRFKALTRNGKPKQETKFQDTKRN